MEKCLYAYAWDFIGEGVESVLNRVSELKVDSVAVAVSYHAGKFILPHSPLGRVYFPEDGTVYFLPSSIYNVSSLRPVVASVLGGSDILQMMSEKCAEYRIKLHAWTVCTHNTRLGNLHPSVIVKNVFQDSYPHSLCPAQPEVRNYILGLIRNLSECYDLDTIFLESLGYMGFSHGYHHEFFGTQPNSSAELLLGLCFCSSCLSRAKKEGIDTEHVAHICRNYIDNSIESSPGDKLPTFNDFVLENPALSAFNDMRCRLVSDLVTNVTEVTKSHNIHTEYFGPVFVPDVKDAKVEGLDLAEIQTRVDRYVLPVASPDIKKVTQDIAYVKQFVPSEKIKLSINLGHAATPTEKCFKEKIRLIEEHQLAGCNIYNYSTLPFSRLKWIKGV